MRKRASFIDTQQIVADQRPRRVTPGQFPSFPKPVRIGKFLAVPAEAPYFFAEGSTPKLSSYYEQNVSAVESLGGYRLRVTFGDGFTAEIDLSALVGRGPIYEPLRDIGFFQRVKVNPEWGVLEWSDDLELSPGSLRVWCEAGKILSHDETDAWIERSFVAPQKVA